jgi:hypothetical protein
MRTNEPVVVATDQPGPSAIAPGQATVGYGLTGCAPAPTGFAVAELLMLLTSILPDSANVVVDSRMSGLLPRHEQ